MYQNLWKRINVLLIILTICLLGGVSDPVFAQQEEQTVLLLNSYHPDFVWTKDVVTPILEALNGSDLDLTMYAEYMDWKEFPTNEQIENLHRTYKHKYNTIKIDLIIATDDKAVEFALQNRKELFSDAPIVFVGINTEGEREIVQGHNNITGVIEYIDLEKAIAMAKSINPAMTQICIIHDQTESGASTYRIVEGILKEKYSHIKPVQITNKSHGDLRKMVKEMEGACAILITSFYRDSVGKSIGSQEFCQEISDISKVPVFHLYEETLGHGNIGGAMIWGREQGKRAGQLALRVLGGEPIGEIPFVRDAPMRIAFDYQQLERFNIPMDLVPKDAEIINKPFSFLEAYKELAILWLVIMVLLIISIIALIIYIREIGKVRIKLQESNEEIMQGYEELTASDAELQRQLKENKKIQAKLRGMAYYDSLTKMPNKQKLEEDLSAHIRNNKAIKSALIFLDADNFKLINDTLGHSIGDKFLVQIANRLDKLDSQLVKGYRMGGDEFILLITNIKNKNDIKKIAHKVMAVFSDGFAVAGMMIHTTVSAGIAVYPDHGETPETLIMRAEIAMYKAKEEGRDRYVFYNDQMNQDMIERASIETNLRIGIENKEFILNYQPQYDLETKAMIGFEALLRWNSKKLGWMPPFKFIKVAEDSRMIIPIGQWVLETACKFIKDIHNLGYPHYIMAVNISALQVMQEDFVEMVMRILRQNDLEPKHLEIEMTETMLIENFQLVVEKLETLRKFGVRVALDDFGTGFSSLNYLNKLPIDTLKIDKSFIDTISEEGEEKTITNILITLGHRMGMEVTAEGVETEQEFDYLKKHGCNHMQGYLLSKPLPEDEILGLLGLDKGV